MDLSLLSHIFGELRSNELIALAFSEGKKLQARYYSSVEEIDLNGVPAEGIHCYFGVCPRKTRTTKKSGVSRALCIWADVDGKDFAGNKPATLEAARSLVLPPSFIVDSGNGHHAYWLLEQGVLPQQAERVAAAIARAIGGDKGTHDASRLMRVPGTTNWKDPDNPKPCELIHSRPNLRYSLGDLTAAAAVPVALTARVLSGSSTGFQSRSERDWHVIRGLLRVGLSEDSIEQIFQLHPVGDKFRADPPQGGEKYFQRTLQQAQQSAQAPAAFEERQGCYFLPGKEGPRQVSTFVYSPMRLLEGPVEDMLVGEMEAAGFKWEGVTLPQSAFSSITRLTAALPIASWQWLGSDREVRMLLPHLMQQLYERGLPKAVATIKIGRHEDYFVTHDCVLTADGVLPPEHSPFVFIDSGREFPKLALTFPPDEEYRALCSRIFGVLPRLNLPGVIYPMLSWFMAAPYKEPLSRIGVRFPILNVFGTRGAGKSSLLLYVLQPLMGYKTGRSYSCATTPFVLLSLLASTNAVPIAFSEFRRGTLSEGAYSKLMRYILLAYDVGRDARGRPDQTTTVYPLDAPFTIDGEDSLGAPAAIERAIMVNLAPQTIEAGTDAHEAYSEFVKLPLTGFAARYLQHTLTYNVQAAYHEASELLDAAFQRRLPDRVRNNLTVCAFGYQSLYDFLDRWDVSIPAPSAETFQKWFSETADTLVSPQMERTPVLLDEFVEDIVSSAIGWQGAGGKFHYRLSAQDGEVWFHLRTAHAWWLAKRHRERASVLDLRALKRQLAEAKQQRVARPGFYVLERRTQRCGGASVSMYGISLKAAVGSGLDVPENVPLENQLVVSFRKGD